MSAGWFEVRRLTYAMLEAARAGDFERVAEQEHARRALLAELPPADPAAIAEIRDLAGPEEEILSRVSEARREAAERLRLARTAAAGARAYRGIGGPF